MPEEEIKILKIQPRKKGSTQMVTIPVTIVRKLEIKGGEDVKVLLDVDNSRIIYQILRRKSVRS